MSERRRPAASTKKKNKAQKRSAPSETGADDSDQVKPNRSHALWTDAHRPRAFADLTFHGRLDAQLEQLADATARSQLPHLLIYGPRGGGKRTRAHCLLRALYRLSPSTSSGDDGGDQFESAIDSMTRHTMLTIEVTRRGARFVSTVKNERRVGDMLSQGDNGDDNNNGADATSRRRNSSGSGGLLSAAAHRRSTTSASSSATKRTGGSSSFDVACVMSPYHLEVTPSDAARKDLHVIRNCVRHLCQSTRPPTVLYNVVDVDGTVQSSEQLPDYRVVIINRADHLTWEAQAAMRRIMERHARRVRFVLICEQASRVVDALRSRCLLVRTPRPSFDRAFAALSTVARARGIALAQRTAALLLDLTNSDMSFATSVMQHNHSDSDPFHDRTTLTMPDWYYQVEKMAQRLFDNPDRPAFETTRRIIYELLSRCVPTVRIVQVILRQLLRSIDANDDKFERERVQSLRSSVIRTCAFFEARIANAFRPVVHLVALAAHIAEHVKRERLNLPPLAVTDEHRPFPRVPDGRPLTTTTTTTSVPPIAINVAEMRTLHESVAQLAL